MKILLLIPIIGSMLIAGSFLLTEGQQEIEDYTKDDKQTKFRHVQFEFYILARDIGDGNKFISDLEAQRVKHVLKQLPVKPRVDLWCDLPQVGEIYKIQGSFTLKNNIDSDQIKNWIKDNIPIGKIRYGFFYLTENTHHWDSDKIQPDKIIEYVEWGNKQNYVDAVLVC